MSSSGYNSKTSDSVLLNNIPNLSGEITITTDGGVIVGATLTANYTGGESVVYQWERDGDEIGGATNQTYKTDQAGSYRVIVSTADFNPKISEAIVIENVPPPLPLGEPVTAPASALTYQQSEKGYVLTGVGL